MQLDELNEILGTAVESEEVDTLGGFIIHMLGHIPENRESIEHGGFGYSVLSIDKQRVDLVLVTPLDQPEPTG